MIDRPGPARDESEEPDDVFHLDLPTPSTRPRCPSKRPGRSFALSIAWLESRSLLSTIGPIAPLSTAATVPALVNDQGLHSPFTLDFRTSDPPPPPPSLLPTSVDRRKPDGSAALTTAPTRAEPGGAEHPQAPLDVLGGHITLAAADIRIDGNSTPEFALARHERQRGLLQARDRRPTLDLGSRSGDR